VQQDGLLAAAETLVVRGLFEASRADRVFRRAGRCYCHFQPLGDNVRETVACKTVWFGCQIAVCCSRSSASHLESVYGRFINRRRRRQARLWCRGLRGGRFDL